MATLEKRDIKNSKEVLPTDTLRRKGNGLAP